ncbi:MAG: hypothetical protein KAX44_03190, partial [Candidatus Brocadiae bacterium]|nr:hypothetical protein [Candidatus Brocadiia bacterium]
MPTKRTLLAALAVFVLMLSCLAALSAARAPTSSLEEADRLFELKQYAEAAEAYRGLVDAHHEEWRRAAERLIMCKLRLQLYDGAVEAAEDYVARTGDTPYEARAERLTAHLYMLLPHWGTRSGGEFYRGEHRQGIRLQSWQYDKKHAVAHMERARELYAEYDAGRAALAALPADEQDNWHNERVECIFDLANLVSRFTIYEDEPHFWHRWWGERDDFLARTAGEEDFDEGYSHWEMQRKRPIGLRLAPDGEPLFPQEPPAYAADLADDQKILYLLAEARRLDETPKRRHTALSLYRQAMLARKRFGMDRLNSYASLYHDGQRMPLQEELETHNPWELRDSEALVLAGGRIRRVELPEQFDVLGLLRRATGEHAESGTADQARYAAGLYYQSRQQYRKALDEYAALREIFADSNWSAHAVKQMNLIREPQVAISQAGVQLSGQPAALQISYRNVDKLWFVARELDLEGLFEELSAKVQEGGDDAARYFRMLTNWSQSYVWLHDDRWGAELAARYVGAETARWSDPVPDDGTHRYANATIQTPLKEGGAYLIYAFTAPAPALDVIDKDRTSSGPGASRAVVVLSDLALVEKRTDEGHLCFVADAASGAPVPGAQVSALEFWRTYDRRARKTQYHSQKADLRTDANGMVTFKSTRDRPGETHCLVTAPGGRLAWSRMRYWRYRPSGMREGLFAYVITDRPVYRPEQTVRFKVWVRRMREGILQNVAHEEFKLTVYDPRGNEMYALTERTDDYGGLDGQFVLAEEPPLG